MAPLALRQVVEKLDTQSPHVVPFRVLGCLNPGETDRLQQRQTFWITVHAFHRLLDRWFRGDP